MTPETFLSQLEGARELRPGRWVAKCPAHEDKSPSLSISVKDDGTPMFHCFSGCGGDDILSAMGLEWADLYPDRNRAAYEAALSAGHRYRQKIDANTDLKHRSAWAMAIAAADLRQGKTHNLEDRSFLAWMMDIAGGAQHE